MRYDTARGILGCRTKGTRHAFLSNLCDAEDVCHVTNSFPCCEKVIGGRQLRDIWNQHGDKLLLIARSIGEPAEDAVQDAFVALASQHQLPDDPLAWMVRVMRNQLLQQHRGRSRREAREKRVGARQWFVQPQGRLEDRLDADVAASALQELPPEQREVIVMYLWGEMTFEAISNVLETSRATTHRNYQRGIGALQRKLDQQSIADVPVDRRQSLRGGCS